jgi:hypothetical protein
VITLSIAKEFLPRRPELEIGLAAQRPCHFRTP